MSQFKWIFFSTSRIMAALIENYQDADGINIPEVLIPYCGFDKI